MKNLFLLDCALSLFLTESACARSQAEIDPTTTKRAIRNLFHRERPRIPSRQDSISGAM